MPPVCRVPPSQQVKEFQSVRYRRVLKDKLPNPLVTTIGGTNSFLTEARNIFKTAADVESLLIANPSQVAVLSLDLGISCVVGATVSLPPGQTPAALTRSHGKEGDENKKRKKTRRGKRKSGDRKRRRARREARDMAEQARAAQFFDLVVRRKVLR